MYTNPPFGFLPIFCCQEQKEIQKQIKAELQTLADYEDNEKEQCPECGKYVKQLNEEHGICRKWLRNYE